MADGPAPSSPSRAHPPPTPPTIAPADAPEISDAAADADADLGASAVVGPFTAASSDPEPQTPAHASAGAEASPAVAATSLKIALLLSSGPRNTFTISKGYLRKRDCLPESGDPYDISVYTLKSLIYREWHPDWEERPATPDFIRLIFFGSLLDDKALLRDSRFSRSENNVVHMSVKPAETLDDDEIKNKEARSRDGNNARPGLNCCVIL